MLLSDLAGGKDIKLYFPENLNITREDGQAGSFHLLQSTLHLLFPCFHLLSDVNSHRRMLQAAQLCAPTASACFSGALYPCI